MSKLSIVCLLVAMVSSGGVHAGILNVLNAGFEDPLRGDGEFDPAASWNEGHYDAANPETWVVEGLEDAGNWNPDAVDGFTGGAAFAGEHIGWATAETAFDTGLSQILTETLQADMEYVLEVQVGNSFYNAGETADYRLELLAGGVLLASATGDPPTTDTWELKTLTYNSGSNTAQLGQPLEIRLIAVEYPLSDQHEIEFDEVSLTSVQPTAGGFVITEISVDDDIITLTWSSRPDTIYSIFADTELDSFVSEVNDNVTSADDENPGDGDKITFSFQNPTIAEEDPLGAPRLFLRVVSFPAP